MYHKLKKCVNSRSSHQRCSIEKGVLKNLAIFTGKHLCWSLLLIDLRGPATFLKRDSNTPGYFPVNNVKFLGILILIKICEQMLLPFLLFTVNISSLGLISVLNSIGLLQWFSSRFKELSFGCLVVGSSLI